MAENKEAHDEGARDFGVFLAKVNDGDAQLELSRELHSLLEALADEADRTMGIAKGTLTLKLGFAVEHNGVVGVKYDVATKEPTIARGGSVFWLTKGRNLTNENPKQKKLPFDVVESKREVRDVNEEKAAPRSV